MTTLARDIPDIIVYCFLINKGNSFQKKKIMKILKMLQHVYKHKRHVCTKSGYFMFAFIEHNNNNHSNKKKSKDDKWKSTNNFISNS